ncbi:MAG: hypothetical protein JHC74_07580 [Thermoleophilia bacterium]|nr:hypothetical protein [Thermoleophilia bacterium]
MPWCRALVSKAREGIGELMSALDAQRIGAARLRQGVHLWAVEEGVSLQHMNRPTERADREAGPGIPPRFGDALREPIPDRGLQALSASRVGYAGEVAALSPRRELDRVVVR